MGFYETPYACIVGMDGAGGEPEVFEKDDKVRRLVLSEFVENPTALAEGYRRIARYVARYVEPVFATIEGKMRFMVAHIPRKHRDNIAGNVWRVGHDRIAGTWLQPSRSKAFDTFHSVGDTVCNRIFPRKRKRFGAAIDSHAVRFGQFKCQRDSDTPRARADIRNARRSESGDRRLVNAKLDKLFCFRTRNKRPRIAMECMAAEIGCPKNILERFGATERYDLTAQFVEHFRGDDVASMERKFKARNAHAFRNEPFAGDTRIVHAVPLKIGGGGIDHRT